MMNSNELVLAAISWEHVDRVPVIPLIIQHAMKISGIPHSRYSTNARSLADAQIFSLEKYGYDGIHITTDNQVICDVFGAKIHFPYDEPPQIERRALLDKDISKLPKFTVNSGRTAMICEATRYARETLNNSTFIKTNIDSAPFSAACSLYGEEAFFYELHDDEAFVHDLLEICSEAIIEYGKAAAGAGAHGLTMGDSSSGIISAALYEKFALPYAQYVIDNLKKTGIPVFYHVCGNTSHILPLLVQTGADVLEIDSMVTMSEIFPSAQNLVALEGNISTIECLLEGTPENVRGESLTCMIPFGLQGGLILSAGCEVPPMTHPDNIFAMVEASKAFI